jgi:hypothetical protein
MAICGVMRVLLAGSRQQGQEEEEMLRASD